MSEQQIQDRPAPKTLMVAICSICRSSVQQASLLDPTVAQMIPPGVQLSEFDLLKFACARHFAVRHSKEKQEDDLISVGMVEYLTLSHFHGSAEIDAHLDELGATLSEKLEGDDQQQGPPPAPTLN